MDLGLSSFQQSFRYYTTANSPRHHDSDGQVPLHYVPVPTLIYLVWPDQGWNMLKLQSPDPCSHSTALCVRDLQLDVNNPYRLLNNRNFNSEIQYVCSHYISYCLNTMTAIRHLPLTPNDQSFGIKLTVTGKCSVSYFTSVDNACIALAWSRHSCITGHIIFCPIHMHPLTLITVVAVWSLNSHWLFRYLSFDFNWLCEIQVQIKFILDLFLCRKYSTFTWAHPLMKQQSNNGEGAVNH